MAQKVVGYVKLQIPAGKATPAPPVGPALGQHGVNIAAFTKEFNERTKNDMGLIIPVVITVYADRSFTFITKTPPAAVLIKKECNIESGSGVPNKTKVATISKEDVRKIAETKMPDLNAASIEAAIAINMGIPYFIDDSLPFIASIVIGTIQLGATVDYSILMTTRYREERLALRSPKAAAQQALEHCSQSILTSGLTFFAATFGVAAISRVELLESICLLISRGALISMAVILLVLPAALMLLDGLICRTTYHWLTAPNAAKE